MNVRKRGLALLMCICMIFTLLPFSVFADEANTENGGVEEVDPGNTGNTEQSGNWNIEVSKEAREWHDGYKTDVTLSVPAEQETLTTDVVFVLDASDCVKSVVDRVKPLVNDLNNVKDENKDYIRVGVVVFKGSAAAMFGGKLVSVGEAVTELDNLIAAINAVPEKDGKPDTDEQENVILNYANVEIKKGSNLHSGLLEAKNLLDNDKTVDEDRKYLINITDGLTYYWNDDQGNVKGIYTEKVNKSSYQTELLFDEWKTAFKITSGWLIGDNSPVKDWRTYIDSVKNRITLDGDTYATDLREAKTKLNKDNSEVRWADIELLNQAGYSYIINNESTSEIMEHANGIERSIFECINTYQKMITAGYKCYTYNPNPNYDENTTFPGLFTSKLNELAGISSDNIFKTIENNILYAVDEDSYVVDKIGEKFILDTDSIRVKLGDTELKYYTNTENGKWTRYFYDTTAMEPLFTVEYKNEGSGTLTWTFNETLSNFEHAQLTYTLELATIDTTPGTHGQLDLDGNGKIDGTGVAVNKDEAIYTNEEAILHYKDTNDKKGTKEFPKPSVAYEIKEYVCNAPISKIATALDKDYKTTVTLNVPGDETELFTDVVFAIDRSQCGMEAAAAAERLVNQLLAQQAASGAKLKVGVIIFGGTAKVSLGLTEVTSDNVDAVKNAMTTAWKTGLHGSNIHSALIEADKMLSSDDVSNDRKYMILVSDGHTYQFSKEGEYEDYAEDGVEFNGLKTYGIYSETDLMSYVYGVTYTIRSLFAEYLTGGWDNYGQYTAANDKYLTSNIYLKDKVNGRGYNGQELPYGTWNEYFDHITDVVNKDNGKYDILLTHDNGDYDNQCIGGSNAITREERIDLADEILGEGNYIKAGLDEEGNDNQLMHASGVDRAVYEAYTKYAAMVQKGYNCYPVYVTKDNTNPKDTDPASTTQDYGYQLIHAMGEISHNTGTSVSTPNEPVVMAEICADLTNAFKNIKNDILYAVDKGSTVVDKIGDKFTLDVSSLKLRVGNDEVTGTFDKDTNTWSFGTKTDGTARFIAVYNAAERTITWTFNEAVAYAAPVHMTYTLTLTTPETAPGHYGQRDLNGNGYIEDENGKETTTEVVSSKAIYTNEYAILNAVDSDGNKCTQKEFPKPSVDYTINRHVNPGIGDEIIVEITGNSDSVVYDGTEHNVKGYTVEISDSRYTEKDFTFSGKDIASGVNAGSYEMGLKADQFKNVNGRFSNIEFVIKADGVLTITPMDLTITAGSKDGIAPVTCNEYESTDLAKGDVIESVKITGEQLEPGQSPNVASDAVIKNAKGEDVTKNYNIKYVDGTLKAVEPLNKEDHFNYIVGYTDGTIRPNNNITRAEVAAIFFRLLTDEARSTFMTDDCSFSDVAQGAWCRRSIATLTNAEIISGYTDGTFKPNAPITRAELATIIARFAKLDVNTKTFSDINGHWAQKYIELAASNGWIDGYTDGTFRPNQNIKRAETFAMINRVLDRVTESNSDLLPTDQMNMWSDNMDFDAWYYRDVQEATNNHKAERVGDSIYEKWTEKLPDIDWAAIQL